MSYNFAQFDQKEKKIKEWLTDEFSRIKTGRATPAIIEKIAVEVYGQKQLLPHVSQISVEDARTLRITPWDPSIISTVQNAISTANLGVAISTDEQSIRVSVPELTEETRRTTAKIVGTRLEEARVSLRKCREEIWSDIQEKEQKKDITKDEKFQYKEALQTKIDSASKAYEDLAKKKEKEILTN